jgi:putative transposase
MRRKLAMCVYGYVVMPEHVHLLLSEPERGLLADAICYLKLSFS